MSQLTKPETIGGGGGGAGSIGWIQASYDLALEDAADWTTGSGHTLAGFDVDLTGAATAQTFGPDGSNGLVFLTANDGSHTFAATSRAGLIAAIAMADLFTGIDNEAKVGICVDFESPVNFTVGNDSFGMGIEQAAKASSPWAARMRRLGSGSTDFQSLEGGVANTISQAALALRFLLIVDYALGTVSAWYSTTAPDGSAPNWSDPESSGFTRVSAAGDPQTVLAAHPIEFDAETDLFFMHASAGSVDCGVTVVGIHTAHQAVV